MHFEMNHVFQHRRRHGKVHWSSSLIFLFSLLLLLNKHNNNYYKVYFSAKQQTLFPTETFLQKLNDKYRSSNKQMLLPQQVHLHATEGLASIIFLLGLSCWQLGFCQWLKWIWVPSVTVSETFIYVWCTPKTPIKLQICLHVSNWILNICQLEM